MLPSSELTPIWPRSQEQIDLDIQLALSEEKWQATLNNFDRTMSALDAALDRRDAERNMTTWDRANRNAEYIIEDMTQLKDRVVVFMRDHFSHIKITAAIISAIALLIVGIFSAERLISSY